MESIIPVSRVASLIVAAVAWNASVVAAPGDTTPAVQTPLSVTSGRAESALISDNGRWIAFSSSSPLLKVDDGNSRYDAFIRNRTTTTISRVSVALGGGDANASSFVSAVSSAGRFVAFTSAASNLIAGDSNNMNDVFVRDRKTATTTRVSVATDGTEANGHSHTADMSADGRYVAFTSNASNLVPGNSNSAGGVFVRDVVAGITSRVNVGPNGEYLPANFLSISSDGRFVAFGSGAGGGVYVHDRQVGATVAAIDADTCEDILTACSAVSISADGRYLAYEREGYPFSYLLDRQTNITTPLHSTSTGRQQFSMNPSISTNGRYVVFAGSDGSELSDEKWDIYIYDRQTQLVALVSKPSDGSANDPRSRSDSPSISADGQYVAFESSAGNFAENDFNGGDDIFVHSRALGTTDLLSGVPLSMAESLAVLSHSPVINADGRFVAFVSPVQNRQLIDSDSNFGPDVFLVDRQLETTSRVSISPAGTEFLGHEQGGSGFHFIDPPVSREPAINANGRYIAFVSDGWSIEAGCNDVFLRNRQLGTTEVVTTPDSEYFCSSSSGSPSISTGGRYVAFATSNPFVAEDSNHVSDVYVYDRTTEGLTRVSVASNGIQGNAGSHSPSISGDGRFIAFTSAATNLVANDSNGSNDVFVHDRETSLTTRVSLRSNGVQGTGNSEWSAISSDGRYVAFTSWAPNLVPRDTNGKGDVFLRDLTTNETTRVSVSSNGAEANKLSSRPSISADGRYVAFQSIASNLVAGDSNGWSDVFVRDRSAGKTKRISVSSNGAQSNEASFDPSISADGRFVAYSSYATNLTSVRVDQTPVVYVHQQR